MQGITYAIQIHAADKFVCVCWKSMKKNHNYLSITHQNRDYQQCHVYSSCVKEYWPIGDIQADLRWPFANFDQRLLFQFHQI